MIHYLYSLVKWEAAAWFILLANLMNLVVLYILPKKFPTSITILILLIGLALAKTANFILGIPPYDLYDINDETDRLDLIDLLLTAVYPPFGYYFLYIYNIWKFKEKSLFFYIFIVAAISVGFEYLAVLANVFHYTGWKLFYSFPIYLISLSLTLLFYRVIMEKMPQGE